ncbi:MAG: DUF1295 domain-containing protein [Gammaproteobacteria bacterium]|nr:DUF1295 domain-containing protein [Gammaproteobacteria bacterium]
MTNIRAWGGFLAALLGGALVAYLGSDSVDSAFEVPIFALCVAAAFVIQWVAFVPAWLKSSERFFDLVGSVTYIGTAVIALILADEISARAVIVAALVAVWATRLGVFLTFRVKREGGDRRFNTIKNHFPTFLMTWSLQAVWVSVTFGPGLAVIIDNKPGSLDGYLVVGVLLWFLGFVIEVIADEQKRRFRQAPDNASRFIQSGLWRWSQHPNYFGEILLWFGIGVIALPSLQGSQYVLLISPVFVWLLLTKVSGVRMLDARARRRWGDDPEYKRYRSSTPVLILKPPRR